MAEENMDIEGEYGDQDESMYPISIKEYFIPWFVRVMHAIPRVDLSFEAVKSDFDYSSHKYKESIMFWIAIPILWLLLTLFLFLMYFCYRCCQQDPAIGIYGNEDTNKGVEHAVAAVKGIMLTVKKIKIKINSLTETVNTMLSQSLEEYFKTGPKSSDMMTRNEFENSVKQARETAKSFKNKFTENILQKFPKVEFCAFGIFSLVLSGLFTGIHLGVSVGISDVCINPDVVVEHYTADHVEQTTLAYYMRCDHYNAINPFNKIFMAANDMMVQTNYSLFQAKFRARDSNMAVNPANDPSELLFKSMQADLTKLQDIIITLTSLVDCTNVHKDYVELLEGLCHKTMMGVLLMLLSSLTVGLLFSLLVIISSKTWRVIGLSADEDSLKSYVDQDEEETGLFISSPHQQQPSSSSPSYYGYPKSRPPPPSVPLQQQQLQQSNIASYNRRTTPPPAYNSNEFYRQYSSSSNNNNNLPSGCVDNNLSSNPRLEYNIRESNT
ncbi:hypothetical protein HELRODRAFT_194586 [Helobdella robusta]|uniref:Protein tweety homolog n=1 Tax=Helobdella robusta TaxID=6412 RepID=T1FW82_HELRO|nr:hypothetical protein HELRODRAFT_194586 [Helobdella robusta]ESN91035.1 hypothetical protein HELRODRAFT_194586 [Helobdella robusta]